MKIRLDSIRDCLEGIIPGNIATVGPDGMPNLAYFSQAHYVDGEHVALSYQFFNTTRRNILANPHARVAVVNPFTAAQYRLSLQYLRTEEAGPIFETMKARLAGIASHFGMAGVFRLLGSDIYRVLDIQQVPGQVVARPPTGGNRLAALRASVGELCSCADLETLLTRVLDCLERHFDIRHAMVLFVDRPGHRLYTVASRGYPVSGIGSEIALGDGVIGVAARESTPICIGHFTAEYRYGMAVRGSLAEEGQVLETEIPLPGLPEPRSQLAVPIHSCQGTVGVLYAESPLDLRFGYEDEDALAILAGQLGAAMGTLQGRGELEEGAVPPRDALPAASGLALAIRHYGENDSIFLDGDYLIKGVAGSIFWSLVRDYQEKGQSLFTNRELRLDSRIRLPDISDNLEARLILLARRLGEHGAPIRLEKAGRGRVRLVVDRPLQLLEMGRS